LVTGATGRVGGQVVAQLASAFVEAPEPMTRAVEELTGPPARTFAQWARDDVADFR
jgi:hypothetical protein